MNDRDEPAEGRRGGSQPPSAPTTPGGASAAGPPIARDLSGRTLHHYRVVERLGQGGMGEVWLAEDLHLDRRLAIKLLPPGDELRRDRLARFEQEAKAVAALDHPNIVTLYSIESVEGLRFLTMELVAGARLDEVVPVEGFAVERFLELAVPLVDAVAAAHERGVTHQDLKPSNVVLTADGRPKILDFGLAELRRDGPVDAGRAAETTRTATATATVLGGGVVGTVPYMSPEQLEGRATDPRTDVFSLGVLFHEMLTGRRPFQSDTPVGLMVKILRDAAPAVTAARPDLPVELDRILERCLAKDPADRFTASELRDALRALRDRYLTGSVTVPNLAAWYRRRRLTFATVAIVTFVAVALAAFFLVRHRGSGGDAGEVASAPTAPTRIAVLPFDNVGAADDAYFASGVSEEIRSRLSAVSGLGVISRASAAQLEASQLGLAAIGEDLDVDYVLDGTVRWDRSTGVDRVRVTPQLVRVADDTQVWTATYDRVLADVFGVQSEIASEVIDQLNVALFPAERQAVTAARPTESLPAYQAYLRAVDLIERSLYDRGQYELAIAELERAVELDPDFAAAWSELALGHSQMYHLGHDRTPERRDAAGRALGRALELEPESPESLFARGYYRYRIAKDYPGALADFRAVTDRLPSAVDGIEATAYVLRRQGDLEGAAERLRRALELDPRSGGLTLELATTETFLRRYERAAELLDRGILLAPNDANLYRAQTLCHWLRDGDLAAARAALEAMPTTDEAVNLWYWHHQLLFEGDYEGAARVATEPRRWIGAVDIPDGMVSWTFFAYPLALLAAEAFDLAGDTSRAQAAYRQALEVLDDRLAASPGDSRLHSARGLALAGLGRRDDAVAAARRGVELLPVALDAGTGPYRLYELALVETRNGDLDAAFDTLARVLAIPSRVSRSLVDLDPRFAAVAADPRFAELPSS